MDKEARLKLLTVVVGVPRGDDPEDTYTVVRLPDRSEVFRPLGSDITIVDKGASDLVEVALTVILDRSCITAYSGDAPS